jgi:hypothetical protein
MGTQAAVLQLLTVPEHGATTTHQATATVGHISRRGKFMRGVKFLVNDDGEKTAVLLNLQDFYDILVSRSRAEEETLSWADLETELAQESSAHGAV